MAKPTEKMMRFVAEIQIDGNGTQAAIRAGYSKKSAYAMAAENLRKPQIIKAIAEGKKAAVERNKISIDRVIQEAARLALFDPRKMFHADGTPKSIHELDDDTAACVAGLDVVSIGSGESVGTVLKYKLAPKGQAIDTLMKYLGGYEKHNAQRTGSLSDLLSLARNDTQ
jgi:phage terminase small subunit